MNMKKTDLNILISQEELIYLMGLLGARFLPGIDNSIFRDTNERDISIAVSVSERALLARGFLLPDLTGKLIISEIPMALVGTSLYANSSVILEIVNQKSKVLYSWHRNNSLFIEHTIPFPGIHKFSAIDSDFEIAEILLSKIPVIEKTNDEISFCIDLSDYKDLTSQSDDNVKKNKLISKYPPETRKEITKFLDENNEIECSAKLSFFSYDNGKKKKKENLIISTKNNSILICDFNDEEVQIKSISKKQLKIYLMNIMKSLSLNG